MTSRYVRQSTSNVLLKSVTNLLSEECDKGSRSINRLRVRSLANQYLAETTMHCLFSSEISAKLTEDDAVEPKKKRFHYMLDTGEMPGIRVMSPVALLVDRIRRSLENETTSELSLQYRSAWLFLACASALGGKTDV